MAELLSVAPSALNAREERVVNTDTLIIGGGPAGLTAAVYACRAGLSAVILEQQLLPGGQMTSTPELENVPGFPVIDGFTLSAQMTQQAKNFGAQIVSASVSAVALEPGNLSAVAGGKTYHAKTIILAMGTRRRRLEIEGEERLAGRGISWCAVCDGNFFKGKPAAVVGGGNTALEDALHMASLGCSVTLLHRRNEFRGSPVLLERVKNEPRISIKTPYIPLSVEGENVVTGLRAQHAQTGETLELSVSAVFECVGTVANTELLCGQLELSGEGRILAGEDTRTAVPGVFAAGDIRQKGLYQVVTASADGAVAATEAARFVRGG